MTPGNGHICPVCGYDDLQEAPYDRDGNPSYEICRCCGYEFGYDDGSERVGFVEYRTKWVAGGATWFKETARPSDWNLQSQLERIGVRL